jgi:hypothetical protein
MQVLYYVPVCTSYYFCNYTRPLAFFIFPRLFTSDYSIVLSCLLFGLLGGAVFTAIGFFIGQRTGKKVKETELKPDGSLYHLDVDFSF